MILLNSSHECIRFPVFPLIELLLFLCTKVQVFVGVIAYVHLEFCQFALWSACSSTSGVWECLFLYHSAILLFWNLASLKEKHALDLLVPSWGGNRESRRCSLVRAAASGLVAEVSLLLGSTASHAPLTSPAGTQTQLLLGASLHSLADAPDNWAGFIVLCVPSSFQAVPCLCLSSSTLFPPLFVAFSCAFWYVVLFSYVTQSSLRLFSISLSPRTTANNGVLKSILPVISQI